MLGNENRSAKLRKAIPALSGVSDDEVKGWMWTCRSGVNARHAQDSSKEPEPAWAAQAHTVADAIAKKMILEKLWNR